MSKKLKDSYHKIGELLVRRNLAPAAAIDEALAIQRSHIEQKRTPPLLGEILIERKVLDRKLIKEISQEQQVGRGQKNILEIDLKDADGLADLVIEGPFDEPKAHA